ncbi:unnamed protein product [Schistosoma mattheei]|nr:unnamed protein product [Schistosoma mattheei]
MNGDASTVSGCSVLTVGESKAVCVLTAMDPKLTEGDEEEKSMSMNGDLNSLVSSRSISSPDRGGTVEPVGAVVPMMVGRRRGRRGTVRGNVGSGESFSPLRLSESVLAEPIVEKGSMNGDASTVSGCSVLTVGESKAVCVLTAMDPKLTEGDEEEKSMSMNGDLNSLVSSRSISSPDRGGTVEPVGAVVPMMVGRRRGRRGTVRGNVGSGEKSMSMNGDLNSLVSSRSISSPDRGGTVEPVGAVVPMMVGRRRGRRGTVRGNVGSGESFSPLRLSESVLAEPIVEKGSMNGDASTVSGCSVLTVGESKAVCVLTAMDPKLTEGDEEEKSMSMNGDLNSLVSSRSISSPDRGGTVEPVGAVVPMMVGRRRGRRGTVRGNVGSGESFSPLRLSESVLAEPIVEKGSMNGDASTVSGCSVLTVGESKAVCVLTAMDPKLTGGGPSFSENKTVNFNLPSRPINVTALSSTFPQSISAVQQLCSVKGTTSKKRLLGEQDRISALMSLNEFEDDYKTEAHRISSKTPLSQLTYSRASSDSKLYPETVDSVLPLIKPVSIIITDCFLESEEDDIVDSGQLVKKRRKNSVVLDEEKNVSRDNSEMLEPPVSSLQGLSPIPYRCEDDVAIPDVVTSDGAKDASNDGMVMLKLPVSSLQALSPIPYRYEDDVAMPEGVVLDEEKNVSRDNSEMLEPPVSSLQGLSPIPYRCEDDVAIPDVVTSDGAKDASNDGMVMLKLPVSSLQALSPIPYRYEDDVAMPEGVVLDEEKNVSRDNSEMLEPPVSSLQGLSPIPYRCEDDVAIPDVVTSDGAKDASNDGMVMLKLPVSSLQALSPIPYRYEDDVAMPEGVVLDEEKNVSRDNSEMLEPPVSSLQGLSPIPYRCEDDVAIPDVVTSDGAKDASNDGMVMLKLPVSSLQALSPIPYRYEDDVAMPEGVVLDEEKNVSRDNSEMLEPPVSSLQGLSPIPYRCEDDVAIPDGVCSSLMGTSDFQNSSRSLSNLPIVPKGRPSVTFAPIVVYFDSPDNSQPRVSVGPIAHEESDLTHFDCELSEKLIPQEGSLTQSENKENIGSFFESTALCSTQDSMYPSPSTSSLSLSRIKLPWCTPYDCQFLPFKSKRPPTKSFIQSDGHLRRSKRLRVPATHDRNKVVVYEPDKDEYGLVYQKPIGLAILPDPDEINRRQKFLNRLKRCQNNRTQFLRNEKINRAKRLQKLAKRYRSLKGAQKPETDPCMRIQLDPDVEWISHTETQLPIGINDASPFQQVIYPENAQFPPFKFSTMEYSSYVVPALSGAFPSRTKTRIPCFEMNANLTRIVSKEQERRQLHYDPNAINVFKMMSSPSVLMNNNSSYSLYAVQIAKFAIPLTKPCIVYIPKGIPYKFLNATKENLNLCRIRYVLT